MPVAYFVPDYELKNRDAITGIIKNIGDADSSNTFIVMIEDAIGNYFALKENYLSERRQRDPISGRLQDQNRLEIMGFLAVVRSARKSKKPKIEKLKKSFRRLSDLSKEFIELGYHGARGVLMPESFFEWARQSFDGPRPIKLSTALQYLEQACQKAADNLKPKNNRQIPLEGLAGLVNEIAFHYQRCFPGRNVYWSSTERSPFQNVIEIVLEEVDPNHRHDSMRLIKRIKSHQ